MGIFERYARGWRQVLATTIAVGCGSSAPPEPTSAEAVAGKTATASTESGAAQPGSTTARPEAPAAERGNVAPTPPPAPSPFHIVGIGGELVATAKGPLVYDGGLLLAEVVGDTIVNHPEYLGTYTPEPMSNMEVVGGSWPERGWITVSRPAQRSSYTTLYERVGKGWRKRGETAVAEWYAGVQPWDRGRSIALVESMAGYYRWEVVAGAPSTVPTPAQAPKDGCCGPGFTAQMPTDFAALTTGELYAVGAMTGESDRWVVERWAPGKTKGTIEILPRPEGAGLGLEVRGITALSGSDAYAYGELRKPRENSPYLMDPVGAYLAHFDGSGWTVMPFPSDVGIASFVVGRGSLWAVSGEHLRRRNAAKPDGSWEEVSLPSSQEELVALAKTPSVPREGRWRLLPRQLMAGVGDDLWLSASLVQGTNASGPSVLLRTRPHAEIWRGLGELSSEAYDQTMEEYRPLQAANAWCGTVFVVLYGVTRSTPENYDYPLTRQAVKGHQEFSDVVFAETEERGKHYFGAFVPELAVAHRLLAVIKKAIPTSKPVALCRNPKKLRVLEIDLASGDVKSNRRLDAAAPSSTGGHTNTLLQGAP